MDKKVFEESLNRLVPGCSKQSIQGWIIFAEENVERGQDINLAPITDKDAAVEDWLDAIYIGLCRVKVSHGVKPVEQICSLSMTHNLYPNEMLLAGEFLKNGGSIAEVPLKSVDGLFDEEYNRNLFSLEQNLAVIDAANS